MNKFIFLFLLFTSVASANTAKFNEQVKPIVIKRCTICHMGKQDWSNYKIFIENRKKIYQKVIVEKVMPMGMPMPDEEREVIGKFIKQYENSRNLRHTSK